MRATLRRPVPAMTAAIALAIPIIGVALPAAASPPGCGDTILVSTVLTQDLVCPSGHGLVVGADHIVLDLGGHTITGSLTGAGVWVGPRTGVTVTSGEISGFATAVELQQSFDATVSKLVAHDGDRGINIGTGGGHLIEKNVISDNSRDGIRLAGSADVVLSKNVLSGNVFGIGIANGSHGTLVEKNVVSTSGAWGIALWDDTTTDNVLHKNVVSHNLGDGIQVQTGTSGTVLTKNEAYANGNDGIAVASVNAALGKNLAVSNGGLGIRAIAGVTDLGGNLAGSNGDMAQCTGVMCTAP